MNTSLKFKSKLPKEFESSLFGISDKSGVYVICVRSMYNNTKPERILYIGSAKNMRKRVIRRNHLYIQLYNRFDNFLVYVKFFETENYKELEKQMIYEFTPVLNKVHNPKKKKKYVTS